MTGRAPRKIELRLGTVATILGIVVSILIIYGIFSSSTKESVTDQLQSDTSAAQAARANAWIGRYGWYVEKRYREDHHE